MCVKTNLFVGAEIFSIGQTRKLSIKVFCSCCWGQFHQLFKRSFYVCRSQKRQKDSQLKQLFALSGSVGVKAARKYVGEIDPWPPQLQRDTKTVLFIWGKKIQIPIWVVLLIQVFLQNYFEQDLLCKWHKGSKLRTLKGHNNIRVLLQVTQILLLPN